jgi:hypothetical protein
VPCAKRDDPGGGSRSLKLRRARPYTRTMAYDPQRDGTAGASAQREHDRRKARREGEVRERHPRIGALLLALNEPPPHERRWAHGAAGEALVAQALDRKCDSEVSVLHDRAIPGSRANIDHIAVAPTGVWVIDTKRYKGKIEVAKPLFGVATLKIAGRDQSRLVAGLAKQVDRVQAVVNQLVPDAPVQGAFCFVDGDLPLLGTLRINGFPLLQRRSLVKRLNAGGPLTIDAIAALTEALIPAFPPA